MDGSVVKWTYLQYQKDLQLPVFIKFNPDEFENSLEKFLTSCGFSKMKEGEGADAEKKLNRTSGGRLLTISEASISVAKQIEMTLESDRYGGESVTPKPGYRVYRYRGIGLLIYSLAASEWQLGVYSHFGAEGQLAEARTIIGRFLGWALSTLGFVGFWGTPVEEGAVIMKPQKAGGEFFMIDVMNRRLLTLDSVVKMKPQFRLLRLDSTLKGRNIRMTNEEYLSFLLHHTCFFDYAGPTVAVRQLVQTLSKNSEGVIHPEESFRPRTNLSI